MKWLVALALAPVSIGCGGAQKVDEHLSLEWLAGAWVGTVDGATVEEHWTPVAGGTMLGVGRTVRDGQTESFEYLRIEWRDDTIVYLASPNGRHPPTEFTLGAIEGSAVTFRNPAHDFPQRIRYRRDGAELHVEIGGQGKKMGWVLRRTM